MKKAHLPKLSDKTAPNATTTTSFPQLLVVSLVAHKPWVQGVEGGTRVKVVKVSDILPLPDWKDHPSVIAAKVVEIVKAWHSNSRGPLTVLIVVYDAVVAARFGAALALSKEQLPTPLRLLIVKSVKEQQKSNQLVCNIAEAVPLW